MFDNFEQLHLRLKPGLNRVWFVERLHQLYLRITWVRSLRNFPKNLRWKMNYLLLFISWEVIRSTSRKMITLYQFLQISRLPSFEQCRADFSERPERTPASRIFSRPRFSNSLEKSKIFNAFFLTEIWISF